MRTTVSLPDRLWEKFVDKAVKRFGHYGGISKGMSEAIEAWVKE